MGTSFSENAGVAKKSLKKVTLGMLLGDIWEGLGRIVDAGGRLFRERGGSKRGREISSILGSILGTDFLLFPPCLLGPAAGGGWLEARFRPFDQPCHLGSTRPTGDGRIENACGATPAVPNSFSSLGV